MDSKGFFITLLFVLGVIGYCILRFFSFLYDSCSLIHTLSINDLLLILSSIFAIYTIGPNLFNIEDKEYSTVLRHAFLILAVLMLFLFSFQQQLELNSLRTVVTNSSNNGSFVNSTDCQLNSSSTIADDDNGSLYVGNKKTHIFHYSNCSSALQISDKNIIDFDDRADAVNNGYAPCKKCKP